LRIFQNEFLKIHRRIEKNEPPIGVEPTTHALRMINFT